jgi:hypothetical protein
MLIGLLVGHSLMRGAYRRFGGGESAARSIEWWGCIGEGIIVVLVLVVLTAVLRMPMGNELNLATIVFWTTFGVWIGFVSRAGMIRKQLRTRERRP